MQGQQHDQFSLTSGLSGQLSKGNKHQPVEVKQDQKDIIKMAV